MDINWKNRRDDERERHPSTAGGWLVILLLCAALAAVTVACYPWISRKADQTYEKRWGVAPDSAVETAEESSAASEEASIVPAEEAANKKQTELTLYESRRLEALLQALYGELYYRYWLLQGTDRAVELFLADQLNEYGGYYREANYSEMTGDIAQEEWNWYLDELQDNFMGVHNEFEMIMEQSSLIVSSSAASEWRKQWATALDEGASIEECAKSWLDAKRQTSAQFALCLILDNEGNLQFADGFVDGENLTAEQKSTLLYFPDSAADYLFPNGELGSYLEEHSARLAAPRDIVLLVTSDEFSCYLNSDMLGHRVLETYGEEYYGEEYYEEELELYNRRLDEYLPAFLLVVGSCLFVLFLGCLFLPFVRGLHIQEAWMSKIPLEVNLCIGIVEGTWAVAMVQLAVYITIMDHLDWLEIGQWFLWLFPENARSGVVLTVNGGSFFGFYLTAALILLSLRRFFVIGPLRYFKEQTITGMVLTPLVRWRRRRRAEGRDLRSRLARLGQSLQEVDFTSRDVWKILLAVGINLLVLTLGLFCGLSVGWLLVLLYSVLLFQWLVRYWTKIREWYENLRRGLHNLADGHLDASVPENVGIFQPLKEETDEIRVGFRKAVEEEVKSQNMKTELITNVSHDLKTPLTAIITYIDLLKEENSTEEERADYIRILDQKSQRLKHLIEDLFEVSKATSGNIPLRASRLELTDLIRQVTLENEDRLREANIELRLRLPEEKVYGYLDGEKLCRILENLIQNVSKYGLAGTRAFFSLKVTSGGMAVIEVKNVSAEELTVEVDSLTERFVRGDASRSKEGSGLGLAIVKSFAEIQGGSFEVRVDADLFTAVVTLPLGIEQDSLHG